MNWNEVLIALIAAGLLKYAVDLIRWVNARRLAKTPDGRQAMTIATVDQSLTVVARARDELQEDNARLRETLTSERARYDQERIRWEAREKSMRAEIDALEQKLRDLLSEVENLKIRHNRGTA